MSEDIKNSLPEPIEKRSLKNLLINPKYQLRYIFYLCFNGVFILAMYTALTYYYVRENYALLIELSPMTQAAQLQLYQELKRINIYLMIISCSFIFIVSLYGLILSHRTAGALYNFKKVFSQIKEGNFSLRINLRPKDDFQDVAKTFNEMMNKIESTLNK